MSETTYSISEVAKMTNIPWHRIKYYSNIGILGDVPRINVGSTTQRRFTEEHVSLLRRIHLYRDHHKVSLREALMLIELERSNKDNATDTKEAE